MDNLIGKTISQGKYKVFDKIGDGRSGKVYSGIEVESKRHVAIKFMEKHHEYELE